MPSYLHVREYIDVGKTLEPGQRTRINHDTSDCSGSSKSLLIERKEDGTIYAKCYRCGLYGSYSKDKSRRKSAKKGALDSKGVVLPSRKGNKIPADAEQDPSRFSPRASTWLRGYGIRDREIKEHGICYSPSYRRLILPVYDSDGLALMQTRKLYDDDELPKYVTYRNRDCVKKINMITPTSSVVLTEDYLSAIKCGRFLSSIPLLSTNISDLALKVVIDNFDSVIIFLDDDNRIVKLNQLALKNRLEQFCKVKLLTGIGCDPKELSEDELAIILGVYYVRTTTYI